MGHQLKDKSWQGDGNTAFELVRAEWAKIRSLAKREAFRIWKRISKTT
jgi:hypothetical protein